MTLITITTVGFSEVHQLSSGGRVYTMFLLMGGVGAAAYTAFTAVELLVDREMRWVLKGSRMENRVKRLRNHVILCGHGRVGRFIAAEFRRRKVSFVVVERERDAVAELVDVPVVVGDATEDGTLRDAGIERARSLVCALASGADNAFIALTARQLKPDIMITARANTHGMEQKLVRAGADRVVQPYASAGLHMANLVLKPQVVEFLDIASTAGSPSVSTAVRMSTICRLPSSTPASLRRTRSIAAGRTQSLKGAPLRKAPGLRASTGT